VIEVKIDDHEGKCRDTLSRAGFQKPPEIAILRDERREFLN